LKAGAHQRRDRRPFGRGHWCPSKSGSRTSKNARPRSESCGRGRRDSRFGMAVIHALLRLRFGERRTAFDPLRSFGTADVNFNEEPDAIFESGRHIVGVGNCMSRKIGSMRFCRLARGSRLRRSPHSWRSWLLSVVGDTLRIRRASSPWLGRKHVLRSSPWPRHRGRGRRYRLAAPRRLGWTTSPICQVCENMRAPDSCTRRRSIPGFDLSVFRSRGRKAIRAPAR